MNLFERSECPFCNRNKFKSIFKKNYSSKELSSFIENYYKSNTLNKILKNKFYELCECLNCKGVFQKYVPNDELSNFLYNEIISTRESFDKKKNYIKNNIKKLNQDYLMINNLFEKKIDNIKILEFGSGWGFWSKFMKSKSLSISTCEFSENRHQHLIKSEIKNFKYLEEINDKFDLIYSEEVLEHVTYPLKILNQLKKKLKEGGFMFHRFPSSFLFKTKVNYKYVPKKDCAHPLEHINIINKESFIHMCEILNLNILHSKKFKNQKFISKVKDLKNSIIFNNVLLQK